MPITEFKVYNSAKPRYNHFPEIDHKLLNSKKGVTKIKKTFAAKIPYNFNLHIQLDSRNICPAVRLLDIKANKTNVITMIYNNDHTGTLHNAMNAWILAHRIMHGMHTHKDNIFEPVVFQEIISIFNAVRCRSTPEALYQSDPLWRSSRIEDIEKFSNILLTMKSARDNKIKNRLDIAAEIFAQYIMTGKVRFNRLNQWNKQMINEYNQWNSLTYNERMNPQIYHLKKTFRRFRPIDEINQVEIDMMILQAEERINLICKEQLDLLVGEIIEF